MHRVTRLLASAVVFSVLQSAYGATHRYHVEYDDAAKEVEVTAFLAPRIRSLKAGSDEAGSDLKWMYRCGGDESVGRVGERSARLSEGVDCVHYRAELGQRRNRYSRLQLPSNVHWSTPRRWLWRPQLNAGDQIVVELTLPKGIEASVPWRQLPTGDYVIDPSPESSQAVSIFGRFAHVEVPVPGAVLRVASIAQPTDEVVKWVRTSAQDVVDVYGRFPNPSPQIVVLPSRGRSKLGVHFGHVIRDGGEAVQFFVEPGGTASQFERDWTASHEFSHLMLPYMSKKWISEGFASYYQNVLMARRGQYSEQLAWTKLARSFGIAAAIEDPPPLDKLHTRSFREMRMLIYWSGAAFALMADVELRRRTDGAESLDTALGRLQACCLPAQRTWQPQELFSKLDQLSGHDVFMPLYERFGTAPGMPDTSGLFQRLGVRYADGSATLVDAEDQAIRDAIMTRRDSDQGG